MPRSLGAEDRARGNHAVVKESIPNPGDHRITAALADALGQDAGGDEVVDDSRPRRAGQELLRHEAGEEVIFDPLPFFVDEKDPVPVPVENDSERRPRLLHRPGGLFAGFGLQRVGVMAGKVAVRLLVQEHGVHAECFRKPAENRSGTTRWRRR